jgi:Protein kinase domain
MNLGTGFFLFWPVSVDTRVTSERVRVMNLRCHFSLGCGNAEYLAATDKKTQAEYAIKIMEVAPAGQDVGGNDNTWADVIAEVSILCRLDHPNIISLREFFIQSNKVYLVTNLVKGASHQSPHCTANSIQARVLQSVYMGNMSSCRPWMAAVSATPKS